MWKPAELRVMLEISPTFIFRTSSANTVGSRAPERHPRLPPLSASRCFRERRGDLSEIGAAAKSAQRVFRAPPLDFDLFRARLLGNDHENVREVVFGIAACLRLDRRQVLVDFGVAHGDLAVDLALAHALNGDLVADVLAVLGIGDVLLRQRLAELLGGKLVVLRDAQDRALDLRIVDLDAVFLGKLQQRRAR